MTSAAHDPGAEASWPGAARLSAALARWPRLLAAALAGVILASAQPPVGFWPAFLIAGPAVFWLWRFGPAGRGAFATGWFVGAGYFGAALHWIVEPFLVDAAAHAWMIPFAVLALAGGLALFWGAAFWAATRLADWGRATGWRAAAALGLCWSVAEILRSSILTGFPWALAAYGWADTPVAQTSALFGPYALTALTLTGGLMLGARARLHAAPAAAALLLAVGWGWGALRLADAPEGAGDGPVIRIIQTDVDQAEKWALENVRVNFEALLAASDPGDAPPPALTIWPESAVTFAIDRAPEARARIAEVLKGSELALGSLRHDKGPDAPLDETARWRNSFFLLNGAGAQSAVYDKAHLVPFGEYMPLEPIAEKIGLLAMAGFGKGIVAGDGPVVVRPAATPPVSPMICYEMIFAGETRRAADGAAWMALITNDGWFGDWAGPAQHLAMAQFRAIETGLSIARSANNGVSAMIDPFGRLHGAVGGGKAATIDSSLPAGVDATAYRLLGDWLTTLMLIALALSATSGRYLPEGVGKPRETN